MVALRVASWNAEAMFTSGMKTTRATPEDAVQVLRDINADILVIPEFGNCADTGSKTAEMLGALSYTSVFLEYNDDRSPGMHMAILSKFSVTSQRTIQLGDSDRKALHVQYELPESQKSLSVIGVHLDDRKESIRMEQIQSLVNAVNEMRDTPILVMGDFNAMHRSTLFATLARSALIRRISRVVPHQHLKSVLGRVSEMGIGTTIKYLTDHTHLINIDQKFRPTISAKQAGLEWLPAWRLAKIDWIFTDPSVDTHSFSVLKDVGSDHRPIVADIELI